MKSTPAIPYMRIVRQYARARGLSFFTWQEQVIAMRLYNETAAMLN